MVRKVTPLSDLVVIRRADPNQVSSGGIYLPPSDDFTEDMGTVVYVGLGKPHKCRKCGGHGRIQMEVAPGDKVIFSTNGHQLVKWDGEELIALRQDSIIAVVEEDDVTSARGIQPVQEFNITGGFKRASR